MRYKGVFASGLAAIAISLAATSVAETPAIDCAKLPAGQKLLELPVRVIDAEGKPVAKAKVTPWALRSSQGHGWWKSGDKVAGVGPNEVVTDENGLAVVVYPQYRDVKEHIRTIEVTLSVDHPEFAYVGNVYIEVPLEARPVRDQTNSWGFARNSPADRPSAGRSERQLRSLVGRTIMEQGLRSPENRRRHASLACHGARQEQRFAGQARWRPANLFQQDH